LKCSECLHDGQKFQIQSISDFEFSDTICKFSVICKTLKSETLLVPSISIKGLLTGCWWLTPVILATQEAQIKRIAVQSQLGQIIQGTLSRKYPTQNRAGGVAQGVQHLPGNCETLNSNPSTAKKKNK
jgi:hypothetical protein